MEKKTNKVIAVVDDEPNILNLVGIALKENGYETHLFSNGKSLLDFLKKNNEIDLVVLDIMLPDESGVEICRNLRDSYKEIGILMLSAKSQPDDKINALEIGADDYVTKPFSPRELCARIKAILRRKKEKQIVKIIADQIKIDFTVKKVSTKEKIIHLTNSEFEILSLLINQENEIVLKTDLYQKFGNLRTIDTHVKNLRKKIPLLKNAIETIYAKGYRFNEKLINV